MRGKYTGRRPARSAGKASHGSFELGALEARLMLYALTDVPALHSDPGAIAKIYLDFNGDYTASWGSFTPGSTPAYDQDGDPTTFSSGEMASIRQIWSRVAEKYSPFNIDVTTVDPGTYGDRQAMKVVIGGAGSWLGSQAGGVSFVGAFTNSAPNVSWVFPKNLANSDPKCTAEATAHEAGHEFGLQHQAQWSGATLVNSYNPGNTLVAPIMGNSYSSARGLWFYGPTDASSTTMQDDLAILSDSTNGFGYRADDHGNSISAASPLSISGTSVSGSGVITTRTDADYFSFTSGAGTVTLNASPAQYGPMLDLKLELRNSSGTVIQSADTSSLGESVSANVPAGTYYVDVASHGSYGDIGQYSISGTIIAPSTTTATVPAAPTGLSASATSSSQVKLTWADNATNETGYTVQRSADGGTTWSTLSSLGANVTSYQDSTVSAGKTYAYRVYASNSAGKSPYSNVATAATPTVVASTVIMDNTGAGVTVTGTWTSSANVAGYYGSNYIHDGNTGKGAKSVRYTPNLVPGTYQVYMRWTSLSNRATNVPVDIIHGGVTSTVAVNEQVNGGVWNSLGSYSFSGSGDSVLIRTGGTNGYVIADAVEFVPVAAAPAMAPALTTAVQPRMDRGTFSMQAIDASGSRWLDSSDVLAGMQGQGARSGRMRQIMDLLGKL